MPRWSASLHAALSCDAPVPEGGPFGDAFAAALAADAEVLGTQRIENGASVSVAIDARDEQRARADLDDLLHRALPAAFGALAGADRDFGWTAGVRGIERCRRRARSA